MGKRARESFCNSAMIELINDDCRKVLPILHGLYKNIVIVTDPPFNIGYHYHTYKDRMKQQEYMDMLKGLFDGYKHVIVLYPETLHQYSVHIGKAPDRVVSWVYNSNTAKQHRDVGYYGIEPDFNQYGQPYKNPTDKRIAKRIAEGKTARLYDWWNVNQVKKVSKEKTEHPAQMPVEVMRNIVGTLPKGTVVVDPFMGSGTTGVACKELGYDFIGIDMDKKYVDIAKQRLK